MKQSLGNFPASEDRLFSSMPEFGWRVNAKPFATASLRTVFDVSSHTK